MTQDLVKSLGIKLVVSGSNTKMDQEVSFAPLLPMSLRVRAAAFCCAPLLAAALCARSAPSAISAPT